MIPLHGYHQQHATSFLELFGYAIPQRYQAAQEEYRAAGIAAMLDASFIGKVQVGGRDREALLHRLTANEMREMQTGESRVNLFTNAKGRVVDRVEMLAQEDNYLLLTSAGHAHLVQKWIEKYTFREEVQAQDLTAPLGTIYLFGEGSGAKASTVLGTDLQGLSAGHFVQLPGPSAGVIIQRPQAAGAARFVVIAPAEQLPGLWQALLPEFQPIGFATYETLRIRLGIPAAGHEIVDDYNPHEIGLFPFINFDKGCYIGQEVIARLDSYQKVQRRLMGISAEAEAPLLEHSTLWQGEQEIGKLTSVAGAPTGHGSIGLAVVRKAFAQPHTEVVLRREHEDFHAQLVEIPFPD